MRSERVCRCTGRLEIEESVAQASTPVMLRPASAPAAERLGAVTPKSARRPHGRHLLACSGSWLNANGKRASASNVCYRTHLKPSPCRAGCVLSADFHPLGVRSTAWVLNGYPIREIAYKYPRSSVIVHRLTARNAVAEGLGKRESSSIADRRRMSALQGRKTWRSHDVV
jgi:hypothetical protein